MKYRLLALTAALVLLLSAAPVRAAGSGDFTITDGCLTAYQGPGGAVTVPEGVTSIGPSAFEHNSALTSVTIPEGVISIGDSAFHNCGNLKRVTLPEGLTSIGSNAFADCRSLGAVAIPEGVTTIGQGAFSWCLGLEQVSLPSTLASIGDNAFFYCRILFSVTIPDSVISMGRGVFDSCPEVVVHVTPGSVGEVYAADNGLTVVADGIPSTGAVAYAAVQYVDVDGKQVKFEMYALKDLKGNDTNYVKLRDVALVISGTMAQFNVGWDGDINVQTGEAYEPAGGEMTTPFRGDRSYTRPAGKTVVDGISVTMDAIQLTDDAGRGYTYYKLRDLGAALGFNVYWDGTAKQVCVQTDRAYTGTGY